MPSSVVHAGFAALVAVGLLGSYYDRRALVFLIAVLLFPEADTVAGFVQTFVEVATDPETGATSVDAGQGGTTQNTHVPNPAQPSSGSEPGGAAGPVDRRAPIAVRGWQLYLVLVGLFTLVARKLQSTPEERP